MKTMREKMADEGLQSFIVTYRTTDEDIGDGMVIAHTATMQFWAEDAGHAGEQMDDAEPGCEIVVVQTQAEYEARTGETLDYGTLEDF